MGEPKRKQWKQFHLLSLVVDQFGLQLLTGDVLELPPGDRISETDSQGSADEVFSLVQDVGSEEHHDAVHFSEIALDGKCAISIDGNELLKQLISGNSHVVEGGPAIIFSMIA
jgi:hypothetical protein